MAQSYVTWLAGQVKPPTWDRPTLPEAQPLPAPAAAVDNAERIRDALVFIPATDRDTWVKIGMAVKAELGDAGFAVWDDWSRTDDSYNARDARDVWRSINGTGKVTVATLFHEAKARGWHDNGARSKPGAVTERKRERVANAKPTWTVILPVPENAPPPPNNHRTDEFVARWSYTDAEGRVLGHAVRFQRGDGKKDVLPQVWAQNASGTRKWCWQAMPEPRPLYGLRDLHERPDADVVVVEGEKTAEAARKLLPDAVVVTWSMGCKAWRKTDWSPLNGRRVMCWPDADDEGRAAMFAIGEMLVARSATVKLIDPIGAANKWDAADALAEGWDCERTAAWMGDGRVAEMVKRSAPVEPQEVKTDAAIDAGNAALDDAQQELPKHVELTDFWSYAPEHKYIYIPTRALWPAASIDARLPRRGKYDLKSSIKLDQHRSVEQITWHPGYPEMIEGQLAHEGGWINKTGTRTFNLYRAPSVIPGDHHQAGEWSDHVRKLYPSDAAHIERWLAQRVQHPGTKINHAIVLGGEQGIGKDTLLEPVRFGVGPWNFKEISPAMMLGRFNPWIRSVILRVSEGHDLGEHDRFAFYEHLKVYTAAPPEVLMCDEKNVKEHPVANVMGVIVTTNHKVGGIYLPHDDRRHFVAWSEIAPSEFKDGYWEKLWGWLNADGIGHVVAYLRGLDLSRFDAKAPPPKTAAWHAIVQANVAPDDAELRDLLDGIKNPTVVTIEMLADEARRTKRHEFAAELSDRTKRRQVPHRLERARYSLVSNPDAPDDGYWVVWSSDGAGAKSRRCAVYGRNDKSLSELTRAAKELTRKPTLDR